MISTQSSALLTIQLTEKETKNWEGSGSEGEGFRKRTHECYDWQWGVRRIEVHSHDGTTLDAWDVGEIK